MSDEWSSQSVGSQRYTWGGWATLMTTPCIWSTRLTRWDLALDLLRHSPYKTFLSGHPWGWPTRPQRHRRKWSPGQRRLVSFITQQRKAPPRSPNSFKVYPLTCTTPAGLTPIITQIPRKAESFSSLSRIFLNDVHLRRQKWKVFIDLSSCYRSLNYWSFPLYLS